MKKYLILAIAAMLLSTSLFSQETSVDAETTGDEILQEEDSQVSVDGASVNFIFSWKKQKISPSSSLGFGYTNLTGDVGSGGFNFYLPFLGVNYRITPHISANASLRLGMDIYQLKKNTMLQMNDGKVEVLPKPEEFSKKRGSLMFFHPDIVLSGRFICPVSKEMSLFFDLGFNFIFPVSTLASTDVIKSSNPMVIERSFFRYSMMNGVQYQPFIRVGIMDRDDFGIGLHGYYQLNSIFRSSKGPDIQPWGIGLFFTW